MTTTVLPSGYYSHNVVLVAANLMDNRIIFNPEGITLQTQDLLYLACRKDSCILLADENDQTKFFVSKASNKDTVAFRNCYTKKYLGLCGVQFQVEAVKHEVDETCEFATFLLGGGRIALKGYNQKYLAPLKCDDGWSIAATRDEFESDCKFYFKCAIEQCFEISCIHWKKIPKNIKYSAVVHDTLSFMNANCKSHTNTFIFPSHKAVEQQTVWKQLWGDCGMQYEHETKFPGTNATIKIICDNMSIISSTTVPLPVNVEPVDVIVAPKKTVIVKLILQRSEMLTLPFFATINCSSAHGTRYELKVDGFWIGYFYKANSEEIQISETELAIQ